MVVDVWCAWERAGQRPPSHEGGEAGQRRPRARHVVHDDLAAVEADDGAALGLRVRVAGVVAHGPLPLPRLPQRVVHVGVVVHERVRLRADALVLALRVLERGWRVSRLFDSICSREATCRFSINCLT